jgi:hypothetical protein
MHDFKLPPPYIWDLRSFWMLGSVPTFRGNMSALSSRVTESKKTWTVWPLKLGPIDCPETTVPTNRRCLTSRKNEDLIWKFCFIRKWIRHENITSLGQIAVSSAIIMMSLYQDLDDECAVVPFYWGAYCIGSSGRCSLCVTTHAIWRITMTRRTNLLVC